MQNGRPSEDGQNSYWSYDEVKKGKTFEGWKAGKLFACQAHTKPNSKPCLKIATGGKFRCMCQDKPLRLEWKGWLPIYDINHKPRFLVIGQDQFERVDLLKDHEHLIYGRNEAERGTVWVRKHEKPRRFDSGRKEFLTPIDLGPWLMTVLWKMPFLLDEYIVPTPDEERNVAVKQHGDSSDTGINENDPVVIALRKKMREKPAIDLTADEAVEVHRTLDFITARIPGVANGKNGKHPKRE